jgi:hypothetical protein
MSTIKLLPGMMSPIDFVGALSTARIHGRAQVENQATVVDARDAQWVAEVERVMQLAHGHVRRAAALEQERDYARAANRELITALRALSDYHCPASCWQDHDANPEYAEPSHLLALSVLRKAGAR